MIVKNKTKTRNPNHKFVFLVGLHKSGTSMLANILKEHPKISGFQNTKFPEDEGQFLQSIFPIAKVYGGPGVFGFNKEMHLTETSPLLTKENKSKLFNEWASYWDLSKPYLLEKSPPNLLKTRFLQEVFPDSFFIVIHRHPIAVSYATQKWSKTSIDSLLKHWYVSYNIFQDDQNKLKKVLQIRYEDLLNNPDKTLKTISKFLNIKEFKTNQKFDLDFNKNYFKEWYHTYSNMNWVKKK